MRIPSNLIFFIDDCHISAMIVPFSGANASPIMTSEKMLHRHLADREKITLSILGEMCKDIRDWKAKAEFQNYEIVSSKVVLSPSWYISRTSVVSKESLKPMVFTEDFIFEAIASELPDNANIFDSKKDLLLIEKSISHVFLNGYPMLSLDSKKATSCKAAVYYCYMSKNFNKSLQDAIETVCPSKEEIVFLSLTKVNLDYAKKLLLKHNDFSTLKTGNIIVINFCSYITEVAYLHSETNLHILSLPIGYKETLHKVTDHLKSDITPTESLLDLFVDNKLKPESKALVSELLEKLGREWSSSVMEGTGELPKTPDSITRLFIFGEDKRQAEIAKVFARLLPFNAESTIQVTLFNDILLNAVSIF